MGLLSCKRSQEEAERGGGGGVAHPEGKGRKKKRLPNKDQEGQQTELKSHFGISVRKITHLFLCFKFALKFNLLNYFFAKNLNIAYIFIKKPNVYSVWVL